MPGSWAVHLVFQRYYKLQTKKKRNQGYVSRDVFHDEFANLKIYTKDRVTFHAGIPPYMQCFLK